MIMLMKNRLSFRVRVYGCLIFLIGFFFLHSANAQGKKGKLKILSYNIHIGKPPSQPGVIDLKAIAKVINDSDADLVALQEVDVYTKRSGKDIDQAQELAKLTNRHLFFVKTIDHDGGDYGIAILSKFPIITTESHVLPIAEGVKFEPRTLAIATVEIKKGVFLDFACTHLDLTSQTRQLQAAFINTIFQNKKNPVILCGDFNAEPNSPEIASFDAYFKRSSVPNGFTFPVVNPDKEIDYVMYSPADSFKVKKHKVIQEHIASDHLPVFVEVKYDFGKIKK